MKPVFAAADMNPLVGQNDESEMPIICIGQGDPVRSRLRSHLAKKEFWTLPVFFVTCNDSLNKATGASS